MEFYITQLQGYKTLLNKLKKQYNIISISRLLVAVAVIVLLWFSIQEQSINSYLLPIAVFILAFFFLMNRHTVISRKRKRAEAIIAINQDEITHLKREGNNFEDGAEFTDPKHEYSYDLDIFGKHSIFQHINRTETYKGKEKLAGLFLKLLPQNEILNNQEAVKELTIKPEFRQEIQALGLIKKDNQKTYSKLINWSKEKVVGVSLISRLLAFLLPLVLLGLFTAYIVTRDTALLSACGYVFIFNLLLVLGKIKSLRNENNYTTEVNEILHQYSLIINQIEKEKFKAEKLLTLQNKLYSGKEPAGKLIKTLSILFSQMDTVGNVLGALIMNGIFQYHVHILAGLHSWKKQHADNIENWLDVIAEFEALNSLANYYYNNQDYIFPQLNTEYKIEFKNLSHPLLNPATRIGNDVAFTPQFTVLTGSNMSGKSTFLRSLGLNMVLAGMGAPVCADAAVVHPLPVLVSMRLSDSLADSESYFFAEIKRLKKIMDAVKNERSFVLLDEILRGTNSDDKRSGTIAVVEKMVGYNAIGAIATHDVEVCETTYKYPDSLVNRCFEAEITHSELYFDYKLREGVCKNKSATFLMKKQGVI
ncbi:MutS-related protein [Flavobacterium suaedae]|nr:DNA mismatch repair protein [Flavobacterium suaedae]